MRRGLTLGLALLLLALAFAAPLLPRLSSAFPHDAGDPLLNTWLLWWNTQEIPLTGGWWNAPMFHPAPDAMALSEVLLGLLPITAPVQWATGSPLAAYNVAFILTFPLCGVAAAFLAYAVTKRADASAVAGVAFAFAPYRMGQVAHLQMLAYYGAPLALAGLHLYDQTARRRWLALFGGAWLLQALTNGYAMFHVSVLVVLWMAWFVRSRRALFEIGAAWGLAIVPALPLLLKYLAVHERWHLARDINEIKRFGADLADVFSAPPELVLWGERLWTARPETAIFPGATVIVVLAAWVVAEWRSGRGRQRPRPTLDQRVLLGISMTAALVAVTALTLGPWRLGPLSVTDFHKPFTIAVYARLLAWLRGHTARAAWRDRSVVGFYVAALFAMYFLALGPEPRVAGRPLLYEPPYAWLMRLPGFASLRVPARFAMLGVLAQSVLLALWIARWSARRPGPWTRVGPVVIAAGLVADGWARLPVADAPAAGPAIADAATAVVELPTGDALSDFNALYHQMAHRRPLVNGYSGYYPPHYLPLSDLLRAADLPVLAEVDTDGTLLVAIDRGRADAADLARAVTAVTGASELPLEERWYRFLVPQRRQPLAAVGATIAFAGVSASANTADAERARDGDLETAWHAGIDQIGNEEFVIDFEAPAAVAAVTFVMGPFAFGYPRELAIDAQGEDGQFTQVWQGPTALAAVRGALERSEQAPLSVAFAPVTTRRLRFRQLGAAAGIPWWIAELRVHAPVQ